MAGKTEVEVKLRLSMPVLLTERFPKLFI